MLLHNRHWKVLLRDGMYWLQPPIEIDPDQTVIHLPSKNPLMDEPQPLDPILPTTPVAGTADSRESRDGGLDKLDQRDEDNPRPGHPHDDHQN
jgi:hypothetical protein